MFTLQKRKSHCQKFFLTMFIYYLKFYFFQEIPIYLRENYSSVYRCETYYLSKFLQEVRGIHEFLQRTKVLVLKKNVTIIKHQDSGANHFARNKCDNHLFHGSIRLWR
jgi:hypothetical protein